MCSCVVCTRPKNPLPKHLALYNYLNRIIEHNLCTWQKSISVVHKHNFDSFVLILFHRPGPEYNVNFVIKTI